MDIQPAKTEENYKSLITTISETYESGRKNAIAAINSTIVETYWKIGQYIVEFEQGGIAKAKYGKSLLENLSRDLSRIHGKGFSRSNLNYMRLFYQRYPIYEELPHKLSWTHFCELVKIDDPLERSFYEKQAIIENWSTTELIRYFENEENTEGDNPPVGIVLAKEKDDLLIKYSMHNISSQLLVTKYQLYLPNKEELRQLIESHLNRDMG